MATLLRCHYFNMRLNFTYDKKEDIWCLLNKGKSLYNSLDPTIFISEVFFGEVLYTHRYYIAIIC